MFMELLPRSGICPKLFHTHRPIQLCWYSIERGYIILILQVIK